MSMRLIDADALLNHVWDADTRCGYVQVVDRGDIEEAPTVVKIVRCKNCKYRSYDEIFECNWCEHEGMVREVKPDFYCGYGEE